jgi:hypothetical protein
VSGEIGEWDFRARAEKWLFSTGTVAFYFRNAGPFGPERWPFPAGLCNFPHATSNDRTRLCHSSLSFSIMRCAELQLLYSTFQMQLKTEGVDSRYVLLFWAKAQFRENVL